MIVELEDGLDLNRAFARHKASSARVAEWEALMRTLQEPVASARPGEWWAVMEPVFQLNELTRPQVSTLTSQDSVT
jgi:hypothetical protein